MAKPPLDGIRVIDSSQVFALPYTGGLLADMGAEVIKVEGPGRIDITRTGGLYGTFPDYEAGDLWWDRASTFNLVNRGKKSLTLDLTTHRGRELYLDLARVSDVVMESYTPRVMRGWGLHYEGLRKVRPDIIMVSNTGYGHGPGPYSAYPAQATTMEGTHGHCWVTGYTDGPPSKAGASFVDFLATWAALYAIGAALRHRARTGRGQWIDLGMYQCGVTFLSEYLMDYTVNGRVGGRSGNRHPYRAPQGCYRASGEDEWVVLSVGSYAQWRALCGLIGVPGLVRDSRFASAHARGKNHDELDSIISIWTANHDKYSLMEMLQGAGVPAGPVLDARDTHLDPHIRSRGILESIDFPQEREMGKRPIIGRPFKDSANQFKIRGPGPSLGEHNAALLMDLLGVGEGELRELTQAGTISTVPLDAEPVIPSQQLKSGRIGSWDADYRARLGLP